MVFSLLQAPNLYQILGNMEGTKASLLQRQGREAISSPLCEHLSARHILQLFSLSSTSLSVNKYFTPILVCSLNAGLEEHKDHRHCAVVGLC